MPHPTQSFVRNGLLSVIDAAAYAAIGPHLEPVDLPKGTVLIEAGEPCAFLQQRHRLDHSQYARQSAR
jgi:hypothetical protein